MARTFHLARARYLPRRPAAGRGLLDTSVTVMRVLPTDLDIYLHVNNGSYLQMMDVARTNLLADLGALRPLGAEGWFPVVAANTMTYRRSLQPFQRFHILTRVVGWDPRVVYLEQVFQRDEVHLARGFVAARFLSRSGERVPAPAVAELLGAGPDSPPLPDDVAAWAKALDVAHRAG